MTDKEVLYYAALGVGGYDVINEDYFRGLLTYWNPLTKNEHAFEIVHKLRLKVTVHDGGWLVSDGKYIRVCEDDDIHSLRRAITFVAVQRGIGISGRKD